MFANSVQSDMLRDIEREVAYTRHEIGRDAFAPRVMAAMAAVPREQFVPESGRHLAFANGPLAIGHGQTISQPYIVALMTDLLAPRPQDSILEIGTGSGYQAAVLAELVRQVHSVEIIAALATAAGQRLARLGYDNVSVRHADGFHGWPEHAPYDGIVVTAAAPQVPPPLVEQLKPGARLVIPVGMPGGVQELKVVEKHADGSITSRNILLVAFVPLTRTATGSDRQET
ncbi:MAG: protein-L-isoaspartate(D-aspartate) O-methyltransferase [Dechloromonas sp.]|uniref:Protein-L-isoaspartate O-methyltransferase n=1 Tax=Candidatus Dechloromonas phosphorivorans TaxID=2899244 RepID=A0A9D7LN92_9RHOO|nr:protein-L-isoaspartate(D-aspartate) O-methyltransferase [Candidatus Dechloromonas phosphorivorans]